ncbi:uncharacterized protein LOC144547733 [Carex rostrata]
MENDNEAHSAPVKIEALDEALSESQAASPLPQLAVRLLAPESGCGNLDLPPSPPPLPLVSESVVPEIHKELSMEMAPPVHQITNEPPLKKRRNMHQKPDQSIEACKIEVETVPLVSGTAEIDTHGEEQMEAPPGSDTIVSGQRGTITQDTPSGMPSRKEKEKEASSGGSKHPPRGRNAYIAPPPTPEERPVIRRLGYRAFIGEKVIATKNVNKIISQCVRCHFPEATKGPNIAVCTKFDDFPDGTKQEVQAEFLKYYQFLSDEDMDRAWKTFSSIANKLLQNLLSKCKKEAKERYGDNILEWKDRGVPSTYDWITVNNWLKLCDHWCTDDFAMRSEQNQRNRTSSKEATFASTGSVNMLVHKQRFEDENQREPRWPDELFTPTHTNKKTGQFCSTRAKKAKEDYDRDMSAKYGPDQALWPSFDQDIWYANTANNAHGDNYGLGALGKTRSLYRPRESQTSSSQSQTQSQSQSYSSGPPHLRQEDINAISSQVFGMLQSQLNQFMEELRGTVGHSSPNQGGSSLHHASNPDTHDDSGDDLGDDYL